jgi:hypothetical protein
MELLEEGTITTNVEVVPDPIIQPPSTDSSPITQRSDPIDEIHGDDAEAIIQSLFDPEGNGNKARYLGYRASGFGQREAIKLVGIHEKTLLRWREGDSTFLANERNLPELRKSLGTAFAHLEFLRNYRLFLEKDFQVIKKSLDKNTSDSMTNFEQNYLIKARTHYTPQQMEIMSSLIGAANANQTIDFTKLILSVSRKTEEIKLETK